MLALVYRLLVEVSVMVARLEAALVHRGRLGLRVNVSNDPGATGGSVMLALQMTNRQRARVDVAPQGLDADGQPFKNPDGSPFTPPVSWSSDATDVADFAADPAGAPGSGWIGSGLVGLARMRLEVGPYPDGTVLAEEVAVAVTNSEPGQLVVTLGAPEAEPAPEPPTP